MDLLKNTIIHNYFYNFTIINNNQGSEVIAFTTHFLLFGFVCGLGSVRIQI